MCWLTSTYSQIKITYKLKLNGGDMKSVQGDSGHAQVKIVADVYSHIIDDDRRLNAQRFEEQFYQTKETPQAEEVQQKTEPSVSPTDQEMLLKLLANPEMATLLKSLAKNLWVYEGQSVIGLSLILHSHIAKSVRIC